MRSPAGDARGGKDRREQLLWNTRSGQDHRCPEVDVRRVRTVWVRVVEDPERDLLGAGRRALQIGRRVLRQLAQDLGPRVVGAVHAVAEAAEALMPGVRVS